MLTNYYTIGYVAVTLQATLQGLRIKEVFTQTADEMVFTFGPSQPSLVFSCRADLNIAYLHDHLARARTNSTDVLPATHGQTIIAILQHPVDRVITILLSSQHRIALQFFGQQANALLLGSDSIIIDAFKKSKQLIGRLYEDRTGEVVYDLNNLPSALHSAGTTPIGQAIRTLYPPLGSTLTKELLHRSGIAFNADASTLSRNSLDTIRVQLRDLLTELGTPRPRVYLNDNGAPSFFSIVPLTHLGNARVTEFDEIHPAIRFFTSKKRAGCDTDKRVTAIRSTLQREQQKLRRTLHAMTEDAREAAHADEYERSGQTLMAHLNDVHKGDRTFAGGGVFITLHPDLTPVQNAQRYFNKAKRSRTAALETLTRIAAARTRLTVISQLLDNLDSVVSREDLHKFSSDHVQALESFRLTPKAVQRAQLPFRTFIVDGGFEVWAGKSSESNDLLTMKHSKPNDLWFHARGSGGSHVVLKLDTGKGEPGRKAREQAAAIAAYYSKMKSSSLVPVAMTKRKHVRKPRGAPPGTVRLERETVLFVVPALPQSKS